MAKCSLKPHTAKSHKFLQIGVMDEIGRLTAKCSYCGLRVTDALPSTITIDNFGFITFSK
jgi:hypothetical protein